MRQNLNIPRLMLSDLEAGCASWRLAVGLLYILKNRGFSVSCCLIGTDFTAATELQRAADRPIRILEPRFSSFDEIATEIYLSTLGSDFLLIVSPFSFYDSCSNSDFAGSPAEIAVRTKTPVVFTSDGGVYGSGIVPLIKGFQEFASGVNLAGVVICDSDSQAGLTSKPREANFYKTYMREQLGIHNVCWLPEGLFLDAGFSKGRKSEPLSFSREKIVKFLQTLSKELNIEGLITSASEAESVAVDNIPAPIGNRIKIAVADDPCFCLGYSNNIENFAFHGAKIARFSPLIDKKIPAGAQILYFRGAIADKYDREVIENTELWQDVRGFIERRGVLISEGSSTAMLSKSYGDNSKVQGIGILNASYRRVKSKQVLFQSFESFQESLLGSEGLALDMYNTGEVKEYDTEKLGKALRSSNEHYRYECLIGGFSQLYFTGYPYIKPQSKIIQNILSEV
jgi:cobyrinic acid a,c-diamide synthase